NASRSSLSPSSASRGDWVADRAEFSTAPAPCDIQRLPVLWQDSVMLGVRVSIDFKGAWRIPLHQPLAPLLLLLALCGCGSHSSTPPVATTPPPTGALQALANQPSQGVGLGFQLTDGSVMFQGADSFSWFKLTPDQSGSYWKGPGSRAGTLPAGYAPQDFSSAVLADGRLV